MMFPTPYSTKKERSINGGSSKRGGSRCQTYRAMPPRHSAWMYSSVSTRLRTPRVPGRPPRTYGGNDGSKYQPEEGRNRHDERLVRAIAILRVGRHRGIDDFE